MRIELRRLAESRPYEKNPRINDQAVDAIAESIHDELSALFDPGVKDGLCDPDEVPAPPDEAMMQHGDLWALGDHGLLCGDSASVEDVDRLLGGQSIHWSTPTHPTRPLEGLVTHEVVGQGRAYRQ